MSAIDLKTMKHRAESILESNDKQFVSKAEKDKWNNIDVGDIDLSNYYTKAQVDTEISKIKALMAGVKFTINTSDWIQENGKFKYVLAHGYDIPIESTSLTFYNEHNENIMLDYTYVNRNTVNIYSDAAEKVYAIIKQIVDSEVQVDLTNYYTKQETDSNIQTKVDELVGAAPDALDTLKELGDALNNDANFATTVTNLIAEKADKDHIHNAEDIEGIDGIKGFETDWGLETAKINSDFLQRVRNDFKAIGVQYNAHNNILLALIDDKHIVAMAGWYSSEASAMGNFSLSTYYLTTDPKFTKDHIWSIISPGWWKWSSIKYDLNLIKTGHVHNQGWGATDLAGLNGQGYYITGKNKMKILHADKDIVYSEYPGNSGIAFNKVSIVDYKTISVQRRRASSEILATITGKSGEVIVDTTKKTLTVHDGVTPGGTELAKKSDLDNIDIPEVDLSNYYTKTQVDTKHQELFQSVSSGKNLLETAITDKRGTVSKVGEVATFAELEAGIRSIVLDDPNHVCREAGKQELLDVMIQKLPGLQNKLTINSPLTDFAFYLNMIGQMLFSFKETMKSLPVEVLEQNVDPVKLNEFNVLMDFIVREEQTTPFTEIFTAFNIPELNIDNSNISFATTVAEKIEMANVDFGHVLYFRNNTSYMFEQNNNLVGTIDSVELRPKEITHALGDDTSTEEGYVIKAYSINLNNYANLKKVEVVD